jgi:hypothetical protein
MQFQRAVSKQLLFYGVLLLACGTETFAQRRDWYSYRVEVTTVSENQYEDESGVTIITRDCSEVADGARARLMLSAKTISGWIAFDGGASCEVAGLIRYEDDENDSPDADDTQDNDDTSPNDPSNMLAQGGESGLRVDRRQRF